jgi:hypothetical protein
LATSYVLIYNAFSLLVVCICAFSFHISFYSLQIWLLVDFEKLSFGPQVFTMVCQWLFFLVIVLEIDIPRRDFVRSCLTFSQLANYIWMVNDFGFKLI